MSLIEYSKVSGLTFTTPDVVAEYIRMVENIQYTGSVEGDTASIVLTNNNNYTARDVTLKVKMPSLTGGYDVTEAKIVKIKPDDENLVVYISTDIPAQGSRLITIRPAEPKKQMNITLPRRPIEGKVMISVNDRAGNPLSGAEVIIDTKYYTPDKRGDITVDLTRGIHTLQIHSPGYESYNTELEVKGRIFILESFYYQYLEPENK
jgi:uncharacterized membrane protein